MTILTLWYTVNKKSEIIARVPHDHCTCCFLRRKKFNDTKLWKLCLAAGNKIINEIFEKTHGLHFCNFHICVFLSLLIKTNHTAHVHGGIKSLKHKVGTTLRLAHHGCENLTHTSKTRHLKRTQLVELLGSRFECFLLFQTAKNRMPWNRRAKWCEAQIRTVVRKPSIGGITFSQGDLTFWKFDKISTDS